MSKMKALVKKFPKKGIWLEEVDLPEYGNNDLLIKIHKTAICGTDLHIYNWDEWSQRTIKTPMTIGHEFVGEVFKIGMNVSGYEIGDRVSGEGHIVCGLCRSCLAGRRHLCPNTIGVGVNRNGCFAEYLSIPASNAFSDINRKQENTFFSYFSGSFSVNGVSAISSAMDRKPAFSAHSFKCAIVGYRLSSCSMVSGK